MRREEWLFERVKVHDWHSHDLLRLCLVVQAPAYLSEMSPPSVRGLMVSMKEAAIGTYSPLHVPTSDIISRAIGLLTNAPS